MIDFDRRLAGSLAVGGGVVGLLLALGIEADVGLDSGLWYPVAYAGAPSVAATLVFTRERPTTGPLGVLAVGVWLLVTAVLALAGVVVLTLGFPTDVPRSLPLTVLFAVGLYLGFLAVPVLAVVVAARLRGAWAVLPLVLAPVAQLVVGAGLVLLA